MHRSHFRLVALMFALMLFVTGCAVAEQTQPTATPDAAGTTAGQAPEAWSTNAKDMPYLLFDHESFPMTFSDLRGKVVYLNFFTSWCPPCKAEMPDILKLQQTYGDELAVVLIHVPDRDTEEDARKFLKENGLDSLRMVEDAGFVLTQMYQLEGYPLSVIIDKEGYLASKDVLGTQGNITGYRGGMLTYAQMEEIVQIAGLAPLTQQ